MLHPGRPYAVVLDGRSESALSFEDVFRALFFDVHRMVGHLLGPGAGTADVEDVTQLVFLTAYKAWPKFRGDARVSTWMYGVACRVVIRQLRGWTRHRRLLHAVENAPRVEHERTTPEITAAQREQIRSVWRCLMRIAAKKRVVYVMHDIEGRSASEIAEILGVPKNTVGSRLRHARGELFQLLAKQEVKSRDPADPLHLGSDREENA